MQTNATSAQNDFRRFKEIFDRVIERGLLELETEKIDVNVK